MSALVLGGLSLNVYLALRPGTLEDHLRVELREYFAVPVEFGSLDVSWERGVELGELRFPTPDGSRQDLIQVRSLRVLPDLWKLLRGQFLIREIVLDEPVFRLERRPDGSWTVEDLLTPGRLSAGGGPVRVPPFSVVGGKFLYRDAVTFPSEVVEEIDDVYASFYRVSPDLTEFEAELRVPGLRRLHLSGSIRSAGSGPRVRAGFRASKVELASPFRRFLPARLASALEGLEVKGVADVYGDVSFSLEEGLVPTRVAVSVLRGNVQHPMTPYALRNLRGNIVLRERLIEVSRLAGEFGGGEFTLSGAVELSGDAWELQRWSAELSADSFPIDGRFLAALPESVRAVVDQYRPRGRIGVSVRIPDSASFPPRAEDVVATVFVHNLDAAYYRFPYRVEGLSGELRVEGGWLRFPRPVVARNGPTTVSVAGPGAELSRTGEMDITVKITGLPLDERFRSSMPPGSQAIWDDFRAVGSASGLVEIRRTRLEDTPPGPVPDTGPHVIVRAQPQDLRIAYRRFPYEITGITGEVRGDSRTGLMTFADLKGRHGEHIISGNGAVQLHGDRLFHLTLHSDSLAVDEDLVAAMSDSSRRLLDEFRFQGRVRVDVKIQTTEESRLMVSTDVGLIEASIEHRNFAFPLTLQGGNLKLVGDHTVSFTDVGTPPGVEPQVLFNGQMTMVGTRRTLGFVVDVERFRFDTRLVNALPQQLARFVQNIGLGGVYRGKVRGSFEFDEVDPGYVKVMYSGEDIVAEEAEVSFGLKVHHIAATAEFVGSKLPGRPHTLLGRVDVSSAWFNRLHLKDLIIDYALGKEHEAIVAAREARALADREYAPPREFLERLTASRVSETFQALIHTKDFYGGLVNGFLYVDAGQEHDVAGHFEASGIEVAQAAGDVFGEAQGAGTRGDASGWVRFKGRSGDVHSVVGEGRGDITNAKLAQLPLFLGLLGVLMGDATEGHYFNEVGLRYTIKDGKFRTPGDGIRINSSGIKLLGGGEMDFTGKLFLKFQPRLLGFQIPVLEQILALIKKGVAEVWVSGVLQDPRVQFVTAAGGLRFGIDTSGEDRGDIRLPSDMRAGREEQEEAAEEPRGQVTEGEEDAK